MKSYKKLIAFGMMTAMLTTPLASFAVGENNQVATQGGKAEMSVEQTAQNALSKKELAAADYAKTVIKDYFGYDLKTDDYIIDVYFSSENNLVGYGIRNTVSVGFTSKKDDFSGFYIAYYEDNKEVNNVSKVSAYTAKRKITVANGLEIAQKFLKEKTDLDLSQFKQKSFTDYPADEEYPVEDYYYQRVHNGIEYDEDHISVGVDLSTGEVVYFYKGYTKNATFPDSTPALTAQEALDIAKAKFKTELVYVTSGDGKQAVPAYEINTGFSDAVDAKTKDMHMFGETPTIEKISKTQKEIADLTKDAKGIEFKIGNKGQAVETANKIIKEIYGIELEPNVEYSEDNDNYVHISYTDKKNKTVYYVSMNVSDERFFNFGKAPMYEDGEPYPYTENQKSVMSYKQAYDMAIRELAKIAPEYLNQVDVEQARYTYPSDSSYDYSSYYFMFPRKVGELKFDQDYIDIEINGATKTVESMGISWSDNMKFASLDGIITPEKAVEKFLSNKTMELRYTNDYIQTKKTGAPVVKLIYMLTSKNADDNWGYIDAKTGNFMQIYMDGYGR